MRCSLRVDTTLGRVLRLALVFLLLNLGNGLRNLYGAQDSLPDRSFAEAVLVSTPLWMSWFLLTPAIVGFLRRNPLESSPSPALIGRHILAMLVFLALHQPLLMAVFGIVRITLFGDTLEWVWGFFFRERLILHAAYIVRDLSMYPVILGVAAAVEAGRNLRRQALRSSQLEAQLTRAELQALKSQLHPHFLFNALNACSTLMRTDLVAAERMLDLLADLLQSTLRESSIQVVPLHRELAFVQRYLDIEMVRFSNRLTVEVDVPLEVQEARVPHLILQPLVENAIRHGISPKVGPGRLRIVARVEGDLLRLLVQDDGVGPGGARSRDSRGEGVGLSNTQARLNQLYGTHATLACGGVTGGGFEVNLSLPLRFTDDPGASS